MYNRLKDSEAFVIVPTSFKKHPFHPLPTHTKPLCHGRLLQSGGMTENKPQAMGSRKSYSCGISYDYSFKVLLVGDSGVGKSSLLLSFISNCQQFPHNLSPTIGVDFKIKLLTTRGKRLKLTIWDTAGQEKFGSLRCSYYRGAHGIILVYDVTRRETFTSLSNTWTKELERYCTDPDCIKILVGNKMDRDTERAVTSEEGMALAQEHKCLFFECSAKTQANVKQCFRELTVKILEVPSLLEKGSTPVKNQILKQKEIQSNSCCS